MATQQSKKTGTNHPEGSIFGLDDDTPQVNAQSAASDPSMSHASSQPISEKVSETASGIMDKAKETVRDIGHHQPSSDTKMHLKASPSSREYFVPTDTHRLSTELTLL